MIKKHIFPIETLSNESKHSEAVRYARLGLPIVALTNHGELGTVSKELGRAFTSVDAREHFLDPFAEDQYIGLAPKPWRGIYSLVKVFEPVGMATWLQRHGSAIDMMPCFRNDAEYGLLRIQGTLSEGEELLFLLGNLVIAQVVTPVEPIQLPECDHFEGFHWCNEPIAPIAVISTDTFFDSVLNYGLARLKLNEEKNEYV